MGSGARNTALASLLDEVGWSVSRLAREINAELGTGYVSRTTASEWVNLSRVPRQPVPTVVAHVLSQATGVMVTAAQLWPEAGPSLLYLAADDGMRVPWDTRGTTAVISDWSAHGPHEFASDRRAFLTVSGRAATDPVRQYVERIGHVPLTDQFTRVIGGSGVRGTAVSPAIVEYFTVMVAAFRRMDDVEGASGENLRYVRRTIGQLSEYLKHGTFTERGLAPQLLRCLAGLCQIAGWMAFDAGLHGLAQRYFHTGLHAAHSVADRDIGAHILGSLTYQAVHNNHLGDAAVMSDAVVRAARGTHPLIGSMAATCAAYVAASRGETGAHRAAIAEAAEAFERSHGAPTPPEYLYWLDAAGAGMLRGETVLLQAMRGSRGARGVRSQLAEASTLLQPVIAGGDDRYQRDATFFGATLARAHIKHGDLHRGLRYAEGAMRHAQYVSSPRSRGLLCQLDRDLALLRHDRNLPEVVQTRHRLRLARAG